jgi:hypothetical protein
MPTQYVIRLIASLILSATAVGTAVGQEAPRYKSAIVALTEGPALRATFETRLREKALENDYDAITTFDLEPDMADLDDRQFLDLLRGQGVQAVLMLRLAAIGPGSSIESVRGEVSPEVFSRMSTFAGEVGPSGGDDLIAVVHMAVYTLDDTGATLVSAGAVWLDEEVDSQEEGIERLQDLIVYNVNAIRPAIRRHVGLPPL